MNATCSFKCIHFSSSMFINIAFHLFTKCNNLMQTSKFQLFFLNSRMLCFHRILKILTNSKIESFAYRIGTNGNQILTNGKIESLPYM
jgi:hypothetical protein